MAVIASDATCRYLETVRILVVEPNDFMRTVLGELLRSFGAIHVKYCSNSEAALAIISLFCPDLILTEWMLRPRNGVEFTKLVRSQDSERDRIIPIILVTAYTEYERIVQARDAGVNEVVAKPLSANSLFRRLQETIGNPRPFIETETYFGPDRRRRRHEDYKGEERRGMQSSDPNRHLSQDEIDSTIAGGPIDGASATASANAVADA
ncbi:MAG: response regulator [Rhodospirillales bacterium]|nr:response regulator [Rhodospirillales bacterium]